MRPCNDLDLLSEGDVMVSRIGTRLQLSCEADVSLVVRDDLMWCVNIHYESITRRLYLVQTGTSAPPTHRDQDFHVSTPTCSVGFMHPRFGAFRWMGLWPGAETLVEEVVATRKQHFGTRHPQALERRIISAHVLYLQGWLV